MPDKIIKIGLRTWRSLYAGPPASGKWVDDDLVIDAVGSIHICTTGGPNPVWSTVAGPAYTPPAVGFVSLVHTVDFVGNTDHEYVLPIDIPAAAGLFSVAAIITEALVTDDESPWAEVKIGSQFLNLDDVLLGTKKSTYLTTDTNTRLAATFSFSARPISVVCRGSNNDRVFTAGKIKMRLNYVDTAEPA